ncbi:hypothetical protein Vadar_021087 [Vaccinium darrowii]|uniref:Uncharacterized protein n=1 Tax=Vaccinium darrowii TaxID=229202 RepID=A0ACB7YF17_9ERIC|nr:hypothetical protein Vadar_021087 [Vaccinium darrowii]
MDIENRFREFLLSTRRRVVQLLPRANIAQPLRPPAEGSSKPPQPPSSDINHEIVAVEQQPVIVPPVVAQNRQQNLDWPQLVIAFCFTSAMDVALQSIETRTQLPLPFHFLSLAIVFAFTSLFVARHISSKFPLQAGVLEKVGIFFAVTAFFVAITVALPLCLKLISWIIFAVSLLVILICNYS